MQDRVFFFFFCCWMQDSVLKRREAPNKLYVLENGQKAYCKNLPPTLCRQGCDAKAVTWTMIKPKLSCLLIFLATKQFIIFAPHDELRHNLVILKIKIFPHMEHVFYLILNICSKWVIKCKNFKKKKFNSIKFKIRF